MVQSNYVFSELDCSIFDKFVVEPKPIVLDIGCNDGYHSLVLKNRYPRSEVHCFEPDFRAIESFKARVGSTPDIFLYESVVSDINGYISFYHSNSSSSASTIHKSTRPNGWDLSGSLKKPKLHLELHPEIVFQDISRVKSISLDTWAEIHNITYISLIWMDVQGAEADMIRGAKSTLPLINAIYTEFSNLEVYEGQSNLDEICRMLSDTHILYALYPDDAFFVNKRFIGSISNRSITVFT